MGTLMTAEHERFSFERFRLVMLLSTELEKCPTLADFRQVKADLFNLFLCLYDRDLLIYDSGLALVLESVAVSANLTGVSKVSGQKSQLLITIQHISS
jgi:hypothetical protein